MMLACGNCVDFPQAACRGIQQGHADVSMPKKLLRFAFFCAAAAAVLLAVLVVYPKVAAKLLGARRAEIISVCAAGAALKNAASVDALEQGLLAMCDSASELAEAGFAGGVPGMRSGAAPALSGVFATPYEKWRLGPLAGFRKSLSEGSKSLVEEAIAALDAEGIPMHTPASFLESNMDFYFSEILGPDSPLNPESFVRSAISKRLGEAFDGASGRSFSEAEIFASAPCGAVEIHPHPEACAAVLRAIAVLRADFSAYCKALRREMESYSESCRLVIKNSP